MPHPLLANAQQPPAKAGPDYNEVAKAVQNGGMPQAPLAKTPPKLRPEDEIDEEGGRRRNSAERDGTDESDGSREKGTGESSDNGGLLNVLA